MKAECSRLIPRKHTENFVLSTNGISILLYARAKQAEASISFQIQMNFAKQQRLLNETELVETNPRN